MSKDSSNDEKVKYLSKKSVDLPNVSAQHKYITEVSSIEGTNVIRVPFGVRTAKRKRPEKNQSIATLILPITSFGNPTPPHVA